MKKSASVLILILLATLSASVHADGFGRRTIGLNGGYSSRGESAVAGIFFKYRFSRHFTLAPNVDYVFRHHGMDGYAFNVNANFPISLGTPAVNLYPLAGVNVSSWNIRNSAPSDTDDNSSRSTHLGLNAGVGFEWAVSHTLTLGVEGYYNWIKDFDGAFVKASIGYTF